jgi:predicted metal-dependent HD superfamily phosphohydrolase
MSMTSPARWQTVWRQVGALNDGESLYERLVACYAEPHRKYHTIQHLNECFLHLDSLRSLADHPDEVELALWFHDAIYDTTKKDNEKRSAVWARDSLLAAGVAHEKVDRIYELVMFTMHNAFAVGRDAEVLVDIDLGILGAKAARFDEYEAQVRQEYLWVPENLYRAARRKVLEEFTGRKWIYSTEPFRSKFEARARENISRSLAQL